MTIAVGALLRHPRRHLSCHRERHCRHPDEASHASGSTWPLASGQLRISEAGSGFENRAAVLPDGTATDPYDL